MTWLAWRQARAQALVAAGALAVIVATLVTTRGHVAGTPSEDLSTFYDSLQLFGTALIGLPAAIGAFWGAPLLARELELGTHRLAWTQGVTRRRWLTVRLGLTAVMTIGITALFAAVFTWWSLPFDENGNRLGTANFGQRGIAPVAYALFALALGTLVGAIVRRTLPAMAITLVGFFVARFAFQLFARPRLIAAEILTRPSTLLGPGDSAATSGAWVMSGHTVDAAGNLLSSSAADRLMVDACQLTRDSSADEWSSCAHRIGLHDVVKAHPADHFWPLQIWESAAFTAAAALLTLTAFWWVRRRSS